MAGNLKKTQPQSSPAFVIEPREKHSQSFILLHGLGSNGEKFGTELLETARSSTGKSLKDIFPEARFIFPTAKKRRSSAFRRSWITQWFDIASLDDPAHKKETQYEGLAESASYISGIVLDEVQKLSPDRVVLGGLSHGCAMSLSLLLCLDFPLAAYIGMSGWLPFQQELMEELEPSKHETTEENLFGDDDPFRESNEAGSERQNDPILKALCFERDLLEIEETSDNIKAPLSTPVFIGHGEADEKIKCALGEGIVNTLKSLDMDVTWKSYKEQGHWYKVPDEIDDILEFLKSKTNLRPPA